MLPAFELGENFHRLPMCRNRADPIARLDDIAAVILEAIGAAAELLDGGVGQASWADPDFAIFMAGRKQRRIGGW
jgi:hypothetical protein